MSLSIEPEQHSTTYYTAGATTHARTYRILKHAYSHTNANTKVQTNIDFIILVSKSEHFFKYQRSAQIQLNNDYFS